MSWPGAERSSSGAGGPGLYQTVILVLESVVFALIGLELPTLVRDLGSSGRWPLAALAVTATLIATRVAWVFRSLPSPAGAAARAARPGRWQPWCRGQAPAGWCRWPPPLSIPLTAAGGGRLPQRDLVLVLAAATIVISLIVQGFTLEPLARLAGFGPAVARPGHEETLARLRMAEAGLARLEELAEAGAADDEVIDRLRASLQARIGTTRARMDHSPDTAGTALAERELRGDLITAETAELSQLYDAGTISAATRQRLQRNLDLETARLTDGHQ